MVVKLGIAKNAKLELKRELGKAKADFTQAQKDLQEGQKTIERMVLDEAKHFTKKDAMTKVIDDLKQEVKDLRSGAAEIQARELERIRKGKVVASPLQGSQMNEMEALRKELELERKQKQLITEGAMKTEEALKKQLEELQS
ncbi:hypothetical protein GOP47_0017277 [Adiantum capillus-veneris]|uniref:Uncharacterized protein n=1 Tax=Adiantum capillus-veneris TaxID=13818 RepID=A0A9D4UG48_ADICA|nr:hypothetical protein GOP47_0017277 [Adiantum capillus-veneris]